MVIFVPQLQQLEKREARTCRFGRAACGFGVAAFFTSTLPGHLATETNSAGDGLRCVLGSRWSIQRCVFLQLQPEEWEYKNKAGQYPRSALHPLCTSEIWGNELFEGQSGNPFEPECELSVICTGQ